jgi:hypothetical protein
MAKNYFDDYDKIDSQELYDLEDTLDMNNNNGMSIISVSDLKEQSEEASRQMENIGTTPFEASGLSKQEQEDIKKGNKELLTQRLNTVKEKVKIAKTFVENYQKKVTELQKTGANGKSTSEYNSIMTEIIREQKVLSQYIDKGEKLLESIDMDAVFSSLWGQVSGYEIATGTKEDKDLENLFYLSETKIKGMEASKTSQAPKKSNSPTSHKTVVTPKPTTPKKTTLPKKTMDKNAIKSLNFNSNNNNNLKSLNYKDLALKISNPKMFDIKSKVDKAGGDVASVFEKGSTEFRMYKNFEENETKRNQVNRLFDVWDSFSKEEKEAMKKKGHLDVGTVKKMFRKKRDMGELSGLNDFLDGEKFLYEKELRAYDKATSVKGGLPKNLTGKAGLEYNSFAVEGDMKDIVRSAIMTSSFGTNDIEQATAESLIATEILKKQENYSSMSKKLPKLGSVSFRGLTSQGEGTVLNLRDMKTETLGKAIQGKKVSVLDSISNGMNQRYYEIDGNEGITSSIGGEYIGSIEKLYNNLVKVAGAENVDDLADNNLEKQQYITAKQKSYSRRTASDKAVLDRFKTGAEIKDAQKKIEIIDQLVGQIVKNTGEEEASVNFEEALHKLESKGSETYYGERYEGIEGESEEDLDAQELELNNIYKKAELASKQAKTKKQKEKAQQDLDIADKNLKSFKLKKESKKVNAFYNMLENVGVEFSSKDTMMYSKNEEDGIKSSYQIEKDRKEQSGLIDAEVGMDSNFTGMTEKQIEKYKKTQNVFNSMKKLSDEEAALAIFDYGMNDLKNTSEDKAAYKEVMIGGFFKELMEDAHSNSATEEEKQEKLAHINKLYNLLDDKFKTVDKNGKKSFGKDMSQYLNSNKERFTTSFDARSSYDKMVNKKGNSLARDVMKWKTIEKAANKKADREDISTKDAMDLMFKESPELKKEYTSSKSKYDALGKSGFFDKSSDELLALSSSLKESGTSQYKSAIKTITPMLNSIGFSSGLVDVADVGQKVIEQLAIDSDGTNKKENWQEQYVDQISYGVNSMGKVYKDDELVAEVENLVKNGIITKDVGDARIKNIQKSQKDKEKNKVARGNATMKKIALPENDRVYYDTETTGNTLKDMPVTFGLYSPEQEMAMTYLLDYSDEKKNKEYYQKAMNIRDKDGKLFAGSKDLRKTMGLDSIGDEGSVNLSNQKEFDVFNASFEKIRNGQVEGYSVADSDKMFGILNDIQAKGKTLTGFNNTSFDTKMVKNFLGNDQFAKLNPLFSNQLDVRKYLSTLTGQGNYAKGGLQDFYGLYYGEEDMNAHSAASDAVSTSMLLNDIQQNPNKIHAVTDYADTLTPPGEGGIVNRNTKAWRENFSKGLHFGADMTKNNIKIESAESITKYVDQLEKAKKATEDLKNSTDELNNVTKADKGENINTNVESEAKAITEANSKGKAHIEVVEGMVAAEQQKAVVSKEVKNSLDNEAKAIENVSQKGQMESDDYNWQDVGEDGIKVRAIEGLEFNEKTHSYFERDKNGNIVRDVDGKAEIVSATQLAGYVASGASDNGWIDKMSSGSRIMKDVLSNGEIGYDDAKQQIMSQWGGTEEDFKQLGNFNYSTEVGNVVHKAMELLEKNGVQSINDLDDKAQSEFANTLKMANNNLAIFGKEVNEADFGPIVDNLLELKSTMGFDKAGMKLSEFRMGMGIKGEDGVERRVAGTFDEIIVGKLGMIFNDFKAISRIGDKEQIKQTIQLALAGLMAKVNKSTIASKVGIPEDEIGDMQSFNILHGKPNGEGAANIPFSPDTTFKEIWTLLNNFSQGVVSSYVPSKAMLGKKTTVGDYDGPKKDSNDTSFIDRAVTMLNRENGFDSQLAKKDKTIQDNKKLITDLQQENEKLEAEKNSLDYDIEKTDSILDVHYKKDKGALKPRDKKEIKELENRKATALQRKEEINNQIQYNSGMIGEVQRDNQDLGRLDIARNIRVEQIEKTSNLLRQLNAEFTNVQNNAKINPEVKTEMLTQLQDKIEAVTDKIELLKDTDLNLDDVDTYLSGQGQGFKNATEKIDSLTAKKSLQGLSKEEEALLGRLTSARGKIISDTKRVTDNDKFGVVSSNKQYENLSKSFAGQNSLVNYEKAYKNVLDINKEIAVINKQIELNAGKNSAKDEDLKKQLALAKEKKDIAENELNVQERLTKEFIEQDASLKKQKDAIITNLGPKTQYSKGKGTYKGQTEVITEAYMRERGDFTDYASNSQFNKLLSQYNSQRTKTNKASFDVKKTEKELTNQNLSRGDRQNLENLKAEQTSILNLLQQQKMELDGQELVIHNLDGSVQRVKLSEDQVLKIKERQQFYDKQALVNEAKLATMKTKNSGLFTMISGGIKRSIANFTDYTLASQLIGSIRQGFQKWIQTSKELDKAMVDLQIVTGGSRKEAKALMGTYNDMASELGRTTQEVAAASNDWLRAGYANQEAAELTKSSMYLSTLGMIDSAKATEYLISTLKGWKLETEDVLKVVDKLTVNFKNAAYIWQQV